MRLLFIDTEVNANGVVTQIWAVDESGACIFHGSNKSEFNNIAKNYDILVGHNILHHDIEFIAKDVKIDLHILQKPIIDTLWLSTLLFFEKPYHRLTKDYKLYQSNTEKHNNPLEDAKLCLQLFIDCKERFSQLSDLLQNIFYLLLKDSKEFSTFLKNITLKTLDGTSNVSTLIGQALWTQFKIFVQSQEFTNIINHHSLAFAYVLRLLLLRKNKQNDVSLFPIRITHKLPEVSALFQQLQEFFVPNTKAALQSFFNYQEFRDFQGENWQIISQEQVVQSALQKKDFLTVFSTWGGKSLTFQLPALMMARTFSSLTLVISPLQSLMKDQVDVLQKRHNIHNAWYLNSSLNPLEKKEIHEKVKYGGIDLLYLSPEALRSKTLQKILQYRIIERIVIDEAHCFSKWWHDFRTDYMFIADFIKLLAKTNKSLEKVGISCFTATAKEEVKKEIKDYFKTKLWRDLITFSSKVKRWNLRYRSFKSDTDDENFKNLIRRLQQEIHTQPCIIFTRFTWVNEDPTGAENLANRINQVLWEGRAQYFHGKLSSQEKKQIQEDFIGGRHNLIIATSAFGMWIDKSDVRYVVHYGIPSSLENYLQEAGRAGRDGDDAHCIILHNSTDLDKILQFNKLGELKSKEIKNLFRSLKYQFERNKKYGERDYLKKSAKELIKSAWWLGVENFEEEYHKNKSNREIKLKSALYFLEKHEFISRSLNATKVWANAKERHSHNEAISHLHQKFWSLWNQVTVDKLIQTYQIVLSKQSVTLEDIASELGRHLKQHSESAHKKSNNYDYTKPWIQEFIQILRQEKLINDHEEISIILNPDKSHSSQESIDELKLTLRHFIEYIEKKSHGKWQFIFNRKHCNTDISKTLNKPTLIRSIDNILNFMKNQHYIEIVNHNQLNFLRPLQEIKIEFEKLFNLSDSTIQYLSKQRSVQQRKVHHLLSHYTLEDLISLLSKQENIDDLSVERLEQVLQFMHDFNIIKIESWLFIYLTKFQLSKGTRYNERLTNSHIKDLYDFYEQKTEQAHIMDDFAQKVAWWIDRETFLEEYFILSHESFLEKYFKSREKEIRRPLSKKKHQEIYKWLNTEQQKILQNNSSLLIVAWPWSGKTKTLVHKVASLVLEKWIRKEEFLLLSFSKSAKYELKKRLHDLLWNQAYYLEINTFHWYAYDLLQREAKNEDFKQSNNIIQQAVLFLKDNPDLQLPYSVLILDEFQDINDTQFELVQLIKERSSKSEEMTIIAAGDDDQSIFWFQGGNIKYIKQFEQKFQAEKIIFTHNYRSTQALVDFTSHFIDHQANHRIKSWYNFLSARSDENLFNSTSTIQTRNSEGNYLYGILEALKSLNSQQSIAVLYHDNETGLLINSLLKQHNYNTKLLFEQGYSLSMTLEVKNFLERCKADKKSSKESHYNNLEYIKTQYGKNKNSDFIEWSLQELYEINSYVSYNTLYEYLSQASSTDLHTTKNEKSITLSTFHKAKGSEFDTVIVCFDPDKSDRNRQWNNERFNEMKRLVYVALTRAKNNLIILGNQINNKHFELLYSLSPLKINKTYAHQELSQIQLITSLKDINLGFNKRTPIKLSTTFPFTSKIFYNDKTNEFMDLEKWRLLQKGSKFLLSDDGNNYFKRYLKKGYRIKDVNIDQRLKYYLSEDQVESLVYLFTFSLEKPEYSQ